jgi:hypothetical protein
MKIILWKSLEEISISNHLLWKNETLITPFWNIISNNIQKIESKYSSADVDPTNLEGVWLFLIRLLSTSLSQQHSNVSLLHSIRSLLIKLSNNRNGWEKFILGRRSLICGSGIGVECFKTLCNEISFSLPHFQSWIECLFHISTCVSLIQSSPNIFSVLSTSLQHLYKSLSALEVKKN